MRYNLTDPDLVALAEFRYHLRLFLRFSEDAARAAGLEPQQHQLLLAVGALHRLGVPAVVKTVAERLQLRHHSVVGLVDRLETKGLLVREPAPGDHRLVALRLTDEGEELLGRLSRAHSEELGSLAPQLTAALEAIVGSPAPAEPHAR